MAARTVTNPEYQRDYDAGYETAQTDLQTDSLMDCNDFLSSCYLVSESGKFNHLKWYYYATGYREGMLDAELG